ncbi:MAG: Hint domain-containing protein, partial [Pseudomonadota bacterium]
NFDTSGIASVAIVTGPVPPQGVTLTVEAFNPSPVGDSDGIAYADIVCFTRDTKILTDRGDVAIQNLKVGDMVMTRDHGAQPLRWVGSRRVPALGHLAPIKIRKGAIGNPEALILSPAHRVLIMGWQAEALFGEPEVFITAQQLLDQDGVSLAPGAEVEYFHILLDGHEIVTANGMPCESLNPSDIALNALQTEQRDEILELFPELVSGKGRVNARPALSSVEAAALV